MQISNSMVGAAATAGGAANAVGISVLNKAMDAQQSQNAQLLSSIPQAPRPGGSHVDLYI
ncbi:MAG TPA: putative motility protein [Stenomitos sp.]